MPVHGNWAVARRALAALEPQLGTEREAIVVDDASVEPPPADLPPATLVRNDRTLGFGPSCNRGAELARGSLLCFLNSDSLVEDGAIEALEARGLREPGAVTGLLLNEDGSLQEAGSSIGRDGAAYPLGAGCRPDDPEWAFRREVDYGSAACLMAPRDAFTETGGFDDRFAPGYYEDADLCLRFAERGLPTTLEPSARVVHLQYGSGSVERAKTLVRRNRKTFFARWGARFERRPIVVAGQDWPHRRLAHRDGRTPTRFLVFADAELAASIHSERPRCRVTLVGGDAGDGIESAAPADVAGWLEQRRFHYSAVLGADAALAGAIRLSQPQAATDLDDRVLPPPGEEPRG